MRRLITLIFLLCLITPVIGKDVETIPVQRNIGATVYNISRARSILFVLSNNGSNGSVAIETSLGSGAYLNVTGSEAASIYLEAAQGDTITMNYKCSAGQIRVAVVQ